MSKSTSLILLVMSLSKSEKKTIYLRSSVTKNAKDYITLFKLIDKQKITDSKRLAEEFRRQCPDAAYTSAIKYLYDYILQILVDLKRKQDHEFQLYNKMLVAKVLLDRNLDSDYTALVKDVQSEAEALGDYNLLLTLQRMELNNVLVEHFSETSEQELVRKQNEVNNTLKILRQMNEQSHLYELLRYRIEKLKYAGSSRSLDAFNDLLISEISLTSNLKNNIFQIDKLHQLFQANYFISIGDNKSALNSFFELNKLFLDNKKQWNNPPVYYVMVIEGILESLRRIKKYDQMEYYLDALRQLDYPSTHFKAYIQCIDFIYSVNPFLDAGRYEKAMGVLHRFRDGLIGKKDILRPQQYLVISLYLAVIYKMNGKSSLARKELAPIITNDSYSDIWIYRPIQLFNLIIYYENGDFEYVSSSIRSIKRKSKMSTKNSKIESILFRFFNTDLTVMSAVQKEKAGNRFKKEVEAIVFDIEERRVLSVFDFSKWILSHFEK